MATKGKGSRVVEALRNLNSRLQKLEKGKQRKRAAREEEEEEDDKDDEEDDDSDWLF